MITGYEVVRAIGAGGFGITYEGFNPITERRVAIKEFFPRGIASRDDATRIAYSKQDGEVVSWALKRFADSTNRLAKLKHPNIIEVLNYVADNGTGYMVMEHVEGQTLEEWLKARTSPPQLAELGPIFDPIFDALEYVHANKLIHRDIAPDNIMIRADGRPVLIDFGALKLIADQAIAAGPSPKSFGVLKANYSPPEQSDDSGSVDPRMDVYSLAATIYRAITGKPPIDADKRKTDTALKGEDPYIPLAKAAQITVPAEFSNTIDAAMSLRPRERPATIAEFRAQLAARPSAPASEPATRVIQPQTAIDAMAPMSQPATMPAYSAPAAPPPYQPQSASADSGQPYTPAGNASPVTKRSGISIANIAAVILILAGSAAVLLHRPIVNFFEGMTGMRIMSRDEPRQPQQPPQKQTPPQQKQTTQPPSRDANEIYRRANELRERGNFRGAIEEYNDAIRLDPKFVNAYTNRGLSYHRLGQGDRAFDDYSAAIRLDPNSKGASVPYLNRAIIWRERLNTERAFEDIDNSLRLDPQFALAHNTRGNLFLDRREYDRAIASYSEAISLDPKYAVAYANRGTAHVSNRNPQRGIEDFSSALRLDPRNINALVGRGGAYETLNQPDRALSDFNEALRYDRVNVNAYLGRGRANLLRRDFVSAYSDFSDAVRLDPRRATAREGRGLANEGLGRRQEAIREFREALQLDASLTRSREALQRLGAQP
jgi:serine/threonine protein kinase/lipoprotein NlpI